MAESRKNALSDLKTCRFCLISDESVSSLYDRSRTPKSAISLPLQIMSCVSVEVFPSDRMLAHICDRCRFFMDICYRFKQICRQADESVMQFVQNNETLEPISWPAKLNKLYKLVNRSPKKPCKNAIFDTNSPKPTNFSEDESDGDDGEGDIYNIKIGEGPDDNSTCIKVFKNGDKLRITKDDSKTKNKKGFSPMKQAQPGTERPFPCKHCDKSFMKSHHFTRHMRIKHNGNTISSRGPFGEQNSLVCDQCDESFGTQDELIYHSAKHATENLICPLCHEKFQHVEQVSAHIKTHVDGAEFMCDLCELVFTSRDKLDQHLAKTHEEELNQEQDIGIDEEESMDEGTYEDDNIHVKEVGDDMIVEIKKPDEFLSTQPEQIENEIVNSNDSESETVYTELATVDTLALAKHSAYEKSADKTALAVRETSKTTEKLLPKPAEKKNDTPTASILRKAEEIKRKAAQKSMELLSSVTVKSAIVQKVTKPETTLSSTGASDKSLRLLEKELQELKRTNNQSKESSEGKALSKSMEVPRNKRPLLHTSTPKPRVIEEKKLSMSVKVATVDKKQPERRIISVTKENKEPKEKEAKGYNNNTSLKDEKEKDKEQKETSKPMAKNCATEKNNTENDNVRRSSRSSKVKDYAKMVRDRMESSDDSDDDDEEYKETEKNEGRNRIKKTIPKAKPSPAPAAAEASSSSTRKRGRPRKDIPKEVPPKVRKSTNAEEDIEGDTNVEMDKNDPVEETKESESDKQEKVSQNNIDSSNKNNTEETKANPIVSPSGHTLKKVPIKSLPPGVKPLPLPLSARSSLGTGELSEMRIGKKVVKVQKIVMTKAEVEAMAKKGLVEMKDGTMVLKQGIKLQSTDANSLKTTLVGDNDPNKESPNKKEKGTPTRCTINDEENLSAIK